MDNLRNQIKSLMDSSDPVLEELDNEELTYVNDLMEELNSSGRQHSITRIIHNDNVIEIETNYKIAYVKK